MRGLGKARKGVRNMEKIIDLLFKLFVAFSLLYLAWHLGRFYENDRLIDCMYLTAYEIDDPITNATSDLYITGDWKEGHCREY